MLNYRPYALAAFTDPLHVRHAENYLRSTGALEGEVRIIEKPFEAEMLVQTVNTALRTRAH